MNLEKLPALTPDRLHVFVVNTSNLMSGQFMAGGLLARLNKRDDVDFTYVGDDDADSDTLFFTHLTDQLNGLGYARRKATAFVIKGNGTIPEKAESDRTLAELLSAVTP